MSFPGISLAPTASLEGAGTEDAKTEVASFEAGRTGGNKGGVITAATGGCSLVAVPLASTGLTDGG